MIRQIIVLGGGSAGLLAALSLKSPSAALAVRVVFSARSGSSAWARGARWICRGICTAFWARSGGFPSARAADLQTRRPLRLGAAPGVRLHLHHGVDGRLPGLPRPARITMRGTIHESRSQLRADAAGKAFAARPHRRADRAANLAYHMENADFVAYLERCARRESGGDHRGAGRAAWKKGQEGVAALVLQSGRASHGGSFRRCFRLPLRAARTRAGRSRSVSFDGQRSSATARVAGGWERAAEPILPYTTAETMDAGWAWQIEHEQHVNRGYVYSSGFIPTTRRRRSFGARIRRCKQTRLVKFRTGYTRGPGWEMWWRSGTRRLRRTAGSDRAAHDLPGRRVSWRSRWPMRRLIRSRRRASA